MFRWKRGPVTLFQSDLYMTNSLVMETDDCVLVTDPCWLPREVEEIRRYVDNILGARRLFLLFTHSDFDHIIGYGAFRKLKSSQAGHSRTKAPGNAKIFLNRSGHSKIVIISGETMKSRIRWWIM